MRLLTWTWRVILLLAAAAAVTTIYDMTHTVDMDVIMPTAEVITVAGVAVLGIIWTLARRYWYVLVLLIAVGLLRGLFNYELLTQFQSVWLLVAAGIVVFVLLVSLIARVLKAERAQPATVEAAAAAAQAPSVADTSVRPAAPSAGEPSVTVTADQTADSAAEAAEPAKVTEAAKE